MPRATQLCVTLENKPGQLARLTSVLQRAKVNIEAISVVDSADCGQIRLVTSSAAKAKAALGRAGMCTCQQPVLVMRVCNQPGVLSEISTKLAKAKINISYIYGSAIGDEGLLVLGVSDVAKAARVA